MPDSPEATTGNVDSIIRKYFPHATGEDVEHIAWGRTGYPVFFGKNDPVAQFEKQVRDYAAGLTIGWKFCELCNGWGSVGPLCIDCHQTIRLSSNREAP